MSAHSSAGSSHEPESDVPSHQRSSRNTYRELFDRSADAILIIEGGTFVDCNQATVEMLRYRNREELLQTHPSELSPPTQSDGRASFEKANEMIALAFERGSHRFEWNHQRADGEVFPVEVLLTAVGGESGRRLHTVWRDITERKRLESELRHAQKMEAIGKLAGGVAHDFNNLLVSILGHSDLLAQSLADRPDLLEHVDVVRAAGERAGDLVSRLLAFGRKQDLQPQVVEVNNLLQEMMKLLERVIGESVEVERDLASTELFVKADPGQLEQVILNLASNASDAMPDGGRFVLRTRSAVFGAPGTGNGRGPGLPAGRYLNLEAIDTGSGIAPELKDRIFDPFFTTKDQGQGTGLGLATAYGIIHQSGGDLSVTSELGRGTTFQIYLPLTEERPGHVTSAEEGAAATSGNEAVLLAEDEDLVAGIMENVLKREGYTVVRAANGEQALALSGDRSFDLLLTDVVMPRMGGFELARILLDRHPDLPVLYMSGYTDSTLAEGHAAGENPDLLQKPFTPQDLLLRVREALDRSRSS